MWALSWLYISRTFSKLMTPAPGGSYPAQEAAQRHTAYKRKVILAPAMFLNTEHLQNPRIAIGRHPLSKGSSPPHVCPAGSRPGNAPAMRVLQHRIVR